MKDEHHKTRHKVITTSRKKETKLPFDIWKGLTLVLLVMVAVNLYLTSVVANNLALGGTALTGTGASAGNDFEVQELPSEQPSAQQPPTQQQPSPTAQVSADDDAVKGDPNAPITIIEFSDFECPYCARFYSETLPQLEKNYIDTGKVKLVYRDFPLGFHQEAQPSAEAAECAGEQGKYYEMHDKIFENQQSMSTSSYKQWAADIGLNTEQFNSCLDSGKYASEVQKDSNDGQAVGVSGTPTFFINGVKIVGAQPYSVFEQVIEQML